ncbi:unnamed protein product, partial [Didymodactylos carnosus]
MLTVIVYDKDDDKLDDYIGKFTIENIIHEDGQIKSIPIIGLLCIPCGKFNLRITSTSCTTETNQLHRYTFDGPIRYSRHDSYTVGRLTELSHKTSRDRADQYYSTFKIQLRRISSYLPIEKRQKWNIKYKAAQTIFQGPLSSCVQSSIKIAHQMLYAKTTTTEYGLLSNGDGHEVWRLFMDRHANNRIKPCIYTYVIDDYIWRFSETGVEFFIDIASKHALHANAAETVRYAGEMHPRPRDGWQEYRDNVDSEFEGREWELVIDNNSGTYAPDPLLLDNLKALLKFNFPSLSVIVYDYKDPELKMSVEECKTYAKTNYKDFPA